MVYSFGCSSRRERGEEANTWSFRKTLNVSSAKCEECTAPVSRAIPSCSQTYCERANERSNEEMRRLRKSYGYLKNIMQCKSVKIFFRVFLAFVMISFLFPLPIHQSGISSYAIKSVFAGEPESENPTSDKFQLVPCGTKDWNNDGRIKDTDEYTEECHFSDFIVLIKRLTDYMIILGAAITAMAFAYAGFL